MMSRFLEHVRNVSLQRSHLKRVTLFILLPLLVASLGFWFLWRPPLTRADASSATVSINTTTPSTSVPLQGIGGMVYPTLTYYQGTERGMTPGDLQLYKARVKKMGITLVRTWVFEHYYQLLSSSTTTYTSVQLSEAYKLFDFYQANNIAVLLNVEPDEVPTTTSDLATFSNNLTNFLKYLHDTRGYSCLKYVMLWNEPNLAGLQLSQVEAVYSAFKNALNGAGIHYLAVTAPDVGIDNVNWITDFAKNIPASLDAYSDHIYSAGVDTQIPVIKNSDDPSGTNKGLFLSEFGDYASSSWDRNSDYTQGLNAVNQVITGLSDGWTGFTKWTLYDNFFDDCCGANQTSTNLTSDDYNWGLWRSKNFGWAPRQEYYAYALLTKFARTGSTIYQTSSSDGNVNVAALKAPDGSWSVFADNYNPNPTTITFTFNTAINQTLQKFQVTDATHADQWATLNQPTGTFSNVGTTFTDTIPARGIATYAADWHPSSTAVGSVGTVNVTDGKVPQLTWNAASNATYYRIYRSTQSGFTPSSENEVGESDSTSFVDESVATGSQTYYYIIVAVGTYEQTGTASAPVTLNHAYTFSNTLNWSTTDDGQDYTITSDAANGYSFKVALRSGVSHYWADPQGVNHITQAEAQYSVPSIPPFMMNNTVSSMTQPTPQTDGHLQVTATEAGATLTYDFYGDHIHIGVSGSNASYTTTDVSYLNISQANWSDGSATTVVPNASATTVTKSNVTSMRLLSAISPYSAAYTFDAPTSVTLNQSTAGRATQVYPTFTLASGGGYTLALPAAQLVAYQSPSGQNLASGKLVVASSSAPNAPTNNLTNGSTSDFWSSTLLNFASCNEWAFVDLGASIPFNRITLTPRFDGSGNALAFPSDFKIQGSNDATQWNDLVSQGNYPNPTGGAALNFAVGAQIYRYVRVLATTARTDGTNYYVQFSELGIYNDATTAANGINIAKGKTATASSTVGWTNTLGSSNAVDGDVGSFWTSQQLSGSAANEWLAVDLGSQTTFDRIVLYPRFDSNGNALAFPSAFMLQGSNDASNWTTLVNQTAYPNPTNSAGIAFSVGSQSYRYVRMLATTARTDGANYYVQLTELEVYNNALSTGASAVVSSTAPYCGCFAASSATDGNLSSLWSSQLLSGGSANEWVYADLGTPTNFNRIALYPRFDNNGNALAFPSAFQLQGSNDATNWTNLITETAYPNPTNGAGAAFSVGSQSYRYIRMLATQARTDGSNYYVQLAELEVENS